MMPLFRLEGLTLELRAWGLDSTSDVSPISMFLGLEYWKICQFLRQGTCLWIRPMSKHD